MRLKEARTLNPTSMTSVEDMEMFEAIAGCRSKLSTSMVFSIKAVHNERKLGQLLWLPFVFARLKDVQLYRVLKTAELNVQLEWLEVG